MTRTPTVRLLMLTLLAVCLLTGGPVVAQNPANRQAAAAAPKDGLYVYLGVPDAPGEEAIGKGGEGIVVLDVDDNYSFVERIELPAHRQRSQAHFKGIEASVHTGLLYAMLAERLVGIDLETGDVQWSQQYDGGCCDRGALSPFGDTMYMAANGEPWWYVLSAYNGNLITKVEGFPTRAHNTIMSPWGDRVYLSTSDEWIHVYDTRRHKALLKVGPMRGRNRPFAINGKETRLYSSTNGYLGVSVADLTTGKILHGIDVPGKTPCVASAAGHGTCQHSMTLTHDETEIWIAEGATAQLHIFDNTVEPPRFKQTVQDRVGTGWITCSLDGNRIYPASGSVYDRATKKLVKTLKDEKGRVVETEKLLEVRFRSGKVVQVGDQWCNGRVGVPARIEGAMKAGTVPGITSKSWDYR